MILYINTTNNDFLEVVLGSEGKKIVKKVKTYFNQAEKLLPALADLLEKGKAKVRDIKEIRVENVGGSFTSLRIGVVTANALGFALGVPVHGQESNLPRRQAGKAKFDIVEPVYNKEPNITLKKN